MLCNYEKCEHYGSARKYGVKCYYEPQCWRGWLDTLFLMLIAIIKRFRKPVKHDR